MIKKVSSKLVPISLKKLLPIKKIKTFYQIAFYID
jgi:hypothetical protein